jgi:hypothetical protein
LQLSWFANLENWFTLRVANIPAKSAALCKTDGASVVFSIIITYFTISLSFICI